MQPHTRALLAAATFAFCAGKKVAGVHDHASGRDLRIAAESRGQQLQGFDGDRAVRFGGTLPDLHDAGAGTSLSMEIDGTEARGYDRGSETFFTAKVTGQQVQLFDHGENAWFAFDIQVAGQPSS
jgi:hypothetical protein